MSACFAGWGSIEEEEKEGINKWFIRALILIILAEQRKKKSL
jgi:hypothetical protein